MRINTNNGNALEIIAHGEGVIISHIDSNGATTRRDYIGPAEIINLLNLRYYLEQRGENSVFLADENTRRYCDNLIKNDDLEEFDILQR